MSGYREPDLKAELSGAQVSLDAAGIVHEVHMEAMSPGADVEAALGWAVREGVTNVIRHSHASCCRIDLAESHGSIRLVITDDGMGTPEPQTGGRSGTGIAGLTERIAALGGTVTVGPAQVSGFRLAVEIPRPVTASRTTASRRNASRHTIALGQQP